MAERSGVRPGLKRKLARSSAVLLALTGFAALAAAAIVELKLAQRQRDALETQIKKTLVTRGQSLAQSHAFIFRTLVADTSLTEVQSTIARTVGEQDDVLYGMFVGTQGKVWAYCSPPSPCSPLGPSHDIAIFDAERVFAALRLTKAEALRSGPRVRELRLFDQAVVEFAEPVQIEGELAGILRYGLSTKSLESAVATARQTEEADLLKALLTFAFGFLSVLAVGVYFAQRTAGKITRPLSELTDAAERFARGERNVRVNIASEDEVQLLSEAFNHMLSELEASHDALEAKNRELETEIEERKRAEHERSELETHLLQAQKMEAFGQLAGGVAHDFNNILAIIVGNTDLAGLILQDPNPGDDLRRVNAEVRAAAERGANLTRQLLTFARREPDNPRVIDVEQTLQSFSRMIRRMLEENVELAILPSRAASRVRIDPGRLEQVLMNLCVNARDAMPLGGRVTLSTGIASLSEEQLFTSGKLSAGSYVWLRCRDTGTGIAPELKKRIFEPFFTTKEAGRGTGLGLAMVHSIVHAAGGAIDVETEDKPGTTFSIYLPAVAEAATPAQVTPQPVAEGAHRLRILLCEDEPAVRTMMRRILERGGHQVEETRTPREALERLADRTFDLLLTDVIMPQMNGKQLADLARTSLPDLTVLFVSGYAAGILAAQGIGDESPFFLRKPFQAQDLLDRVRRLTERPSSP